MGNIIVGYGRSLIDGIGDLEEADVWNDGEWNPGSEAEPTGLASGNGSEPILEHDAHEKDERA